MNARPGLLLTFYGDDFTGSTDVMEVLTLAGVPTVLFLDVPTPERLAQFGEARAIGVAGLARTMTPEQMAVDLPPIFRGLRDIAAPVFHYKLCSTFDSSPGVGSIGRALELARETFGPRVIPLVVGVPPLGRYCVFGHLFARTVSTVYRLDKHPTLSAHPVTPMRESDLRIHLADQTSLVVALLDLPSLRSEKRTAHLTSLVHAEPRPSAVLCDALDDSDLVAIGGLIDQIWQASDSSDTDTRVAFGSSGIEYALTALWRQQGELASGVVEPRAVEAPPQTLAVVGSTAASSRAQLSYALDHGFRGLEIDTALVTGSPYLAQALSDYVAAALALLDTGDHVVMYSSLDGSAGVDPHTIARRLADLTALVVRQRRPGRVIVAGGDTSGYVARALDIHALSLIAALAPGAPLCIAHSDNPAIEGLQIMLKGGQIGPESYFADVADFSTRQPIH